MKASVTDLAALGGPPEFASDLHVGRPNIGDQSRFLSYVSDMFTRRWLTNHGPLVREFEARIALLSGAKHCIALTNATVGLEIAARAAGLKGEVIVPSFTFIATAHSLEYQGITPVFCDVDPITHTIDPARLEALITPRTTGIVGVHLWGRTCNAEAIAEVARRHRLVVLYDAAHAFGCTRHGRPLGDFGLASVLSFHATKFLNAFEGGAVLTNDDDFAERVRQMHNFGFSRHDQVDSVGTNGKMTEVAAAMGLTSLDAMDDFIAVNRRNYQAYRSGLDSVRGLRVIQYDETESNNFQYVVVEIDEATAGISRDTLLHLLHKERVLARRYFHPGCHNASPYRDRPLPSDRLPVTNTLIHTVLAFPTGTSVDELTVARICGIVRFAVENGAEIRARLGAPTAQKPLPLPADAQAAPVLPALVSTPLPPQLNAA
jgi:dTDP-4-amino-4,6-dideoxygalactose transaminase